MKRWQDRGEVEDSDDEEELELTLTPSPERPAKRLKIERSHDEFGESNDGVTFAESDAGRVSPDEDGIAWLPAKVAKTYGRKGKLVKPTQRPSSARQAAQNERGDDVFDIFAASTSKEPTEDADGPIAFNESTSPARRGTRSIAPLSSAHALEQQESSDGSANPFGSPARETWVESATPRSTTPTAGRFSPAPKTTAAVSPDESQPSSELNRVSIAPGPELSSVRDVASPAASPVSKARRSLRARKEVQLHPYMIDKATYQRQCRERGLRPVRLLDQEPVPEMTKSLSTYSSIENESQEYATQATTSPASSPIRGRPIAYVDRGLNSNFSYFAERDSSDSEDGSAGPAFKRTDNIIPPSPPPTSSSDETSTTSQVRPSKQFIRLQYPRNISPPSMPTPQISSEVKTSVSTRRHGKHGRRTAPLQSDQSSRSSSPDVGAVSDAQSDVDSEVQRLRREQRRIKGVLPASWLRIDMRARTTLKPSLDTNRASEAVTSPHPTPQPLRGVARRITTSGALENSALPVDFSADEGTQSDASVKYLGPASRHPRLEHHSSYEYAIQDRHDDDLMEHDVVDAMLVGRSRTTERRCHTPQPRIDLALQRLARGDRSTAQEARASDGRRTRDQRASWPRAKDHGKRGPGAPPSIQLSIEDAQMSPPMQSGKMPQFVRLAIRRARQAPNRGRHTADCKVVDLSTRHDTNDALTTLHAWRQGEIVPRATNSGEYEAAHVDHVSGQGQLVRASTNDVAPPGQHINRVIRSTDARRPRLRRPATRHMNIQATIPAHERQPHSIRMQAGSSRGTGARHAPKPPRLRTAQLESLQHEFDESHRAAMFDRRVQLLTENVATRGPRSSRTNLQLQRYFHDGAVADAVSLEADAGTNAMHGARKIPCRSRKRQARKLNVNPGDHIEVFEDFAQPGLHFEDNRWSVDPEGPTLQGLPPFGTHFSIDFNIEPPAREGRVCNDFFIASGELHEALDFVHRDLSRPQGQIQLRVADELWQWHAWDEQVAAQLSRIPQVIATALQSLCNADAAEDSLQNVEIVLQHVAYLLGSVVRYCSRCLHFLDPIDRRRCVESLNSFLIDSYEVFTESELRGALGKPNDKLCTLQYLTVIASQAMQLSSCATVPDEVQALANKNFREVAEMLCALILPGHIQDLQRHLERNYVGNDGPLQDGESCRCLGSIIILRHTLDRCNQGHGLWDLVNEVIGRSIEQYTTLADLEKVWHNLFVLLPTFSIDDTGVMRRPGQAEVSGSVWALPRRLLARVFELYDTSSKVRGHTVNEYVRALLSRCHRLITVWTWRRCESIIFHIYDFFSRRHLSLLRSEEAHGSPAFLDELESVPDLEVDVNDKSFHVFLKIVATSLLAMREHQILEDRKIGSNVTWRLIPSHGRTYAKDKNMQRTDLDALRNHHDLLCTLYYASPAGHRPGVGLFRQLVNHSTSHREACRVNVRAWTILTCFQSSRIEPPSGLDDLIAWFNDIVTSTITQYKLAKIEAEQDAASAQERGTEIGDKTLRGTIANNQRTIAATLSDALAGLRKAMKTACTVGVLEKLVQGTKFWTALDIFDPSQRRLLGTVNEVLQLTDTALGVHHELVPKADSQLVSEDSQEFGDSTALHELVASETACEAWRFSVADTLFTPVSHLMSNVFGADAQTDDILAQKLVIVWIRIASDLVRDGKKSWASYIDEYSPNSWKQMRDTRQTRVFAPFFMSCIVEHASEDMEVRQQILTAWLLSLVEREASLRFQHVLTGALLNTYQDEPLLKNLPFARNLATGHFQVSLEELKSRRLAVISSILWNMRQALAESGARHPSSVAAMKTSFRAMLCEMMHAMKTHYQDLQARERQDSADEGVQGAYVDFVQNVVSYLQQHSADFCQVDKFFTDSVAFPLPATDPTYVVSKLRGYVPKLCDGRSRKDLAIFVQSVCERAIVDGQQGYLTEQMSTAMCGMFETGDDRSPTLRRMLLTTILPVYMSLALHKHCVWIFLEPFLRACQRVVADLVYQFHQSEPSSLQAATQTVLVVQANIVSTIEQVHSSPALLADTAVLNALKWMFEVCTSALDFTATMHRCDAGDNKLVQLARILRTHGPTLVANVQSPSECICADFEAIEYQVDNPWPDTRTFAENNIETSMKNWYVLDGQYFVQRGGLSKPVPMHHCDYEVAREMLFRAVERYGVAFDGIFEPRCRREQAAVDDSCGLGNLLV